MEIVDQEASSKLRLSSKRLKSGKLQVKFELTRELKGVEYGYLLTEPKTSLKEVVHRIFWNFETGNKLGYHSHLYNIGRARQSTEMLFFR
jgi:hypothetical protein